MDLLELVKILGALAVALAGREAIGYGVKRVRRLRNGSEFPPGYGYSMIGIDAQDITNPNLRPITQGECSITKDAICSKIDEQARRLEGHGEQIKALDKSLVKMNITLTEINGDIKEMKAGADGRMHAIARREASDSRSEHERSHYHAKERRSIPSTGEYPSSGRR